MTQRAYTSLTIASYLQTFVEPKTAELKWESRLKIFRRRAQARFRQLRLGEYFNYLLIYLLLIMINLLLSVGYVIDELRLSPLLTLAAILIACVGALTIWFLWTSLNIVKMYTANSGETFDKIWKEVKEEGKDD
jgi:hypothetical protein